MSHDSLDAQEFVSLLLRNGANIEARDNMGRTPLQDAVKIGCCVAYAVWLLDKGADIHTRDEKAATPLHDVCHPCMQDLLLERGADVTAVDDRSRTPLHSLIYLSFDEFDDIYWEEDNHETRMKMIETLLHQKGIDLDARDADGQTALHYAVTKENLDVVRLLLKHGADAKVEDVHDKTPIHYVFDTLLTVDLLEAFQEYVDIDVDDDYVDMCESVNRTVALRRELEEVKRRHADELRRNKTECQTLIVTAAILARTGFSKEA